MTTQSRRWLRAFGAFGVALACAALLVLGQMGRAEAQPFAAVVMDARTGQILYQTDNSTARIHPASLTKMMTLYIAFEALENGEISLDTRVRISRHAAAQPPSRLGLRAGQTIAFRYLIRAAALRSANDAAVAIAEALEGSVSSFADRMNRTARAIGMTRTTFRNPHGLTTDGHLSSARDMSLLGRQLYFDHPDYYNIFSRRTEDAGIATVSNTNRRFLDSYRGADGIKTGFTNAAGYNLVAMAERDGVRILVAVMGARSSAQRLERVTQLMDRGFRLAPRRAAVRRPARPDYVHAPEDRGSGPAAGRVIRLQTAPTTSRFPRARPLPGQAPSEDVIASLREGIDEVIDEIREPDPNADTDESGVDTGVSSEEPDEGNADPAADAPALVAAAAPERSPMPRTRPEAMAVAQAGVPATDEAARAAGFTVIEPAQYAALTSAEPVLPEPIASAETAQEAPPPRPEDRTADAGSVGGTEAPADAPTPFVHDAQVVADVTVDANGVIIPGLPPIAVDPATPSQGEPSVIPVIEVAAATEPPPMTPLAPELSVDDSGRILWRDEELLQALDHEDSGDPVLLPTIVLTTSAGDDGASAPAAAPMPEIISRVSTSGGRLYSVELGAYGSRFDADRVLLRLALSESATLGTGVRSVEVRAGRYVARVQSLGQDEAEVACLRLTARDEPCTVVEPN